MQQKGNQELLFGHKNLRWVIQLKIYDVREQLRGEFCAGIKLMRVAERKMVFKAIELYEITEKVHVKGEDSFEELPYFRVDT